jgi:SAM-dependent methyltransferase
VVLYPLGDLFLISDRVMLPDGTPVDDPEFVYFALTPNTLRFLRTLPQLPCGSFLDVGSGCGAAALAQSAYARIAVASDVSAKSSHYAEFNRRLNGIENVEIVQASIYDGVAGRQFDRIGCHPPYDMSASVQWTFAAGGDDGEGVIRSVVQGLPDHLAPGGEFITLFRAADCKGVPMEHRLRSWLGERHQEFDVVLVVAETSTVQEHVFSAVVSARAEMDVYRSWMKSFAERGVEQMVYGSVLIRRKLFGSPPVTVRVCGVALGSGLGADYGRYRSRKCRFASLTRHRVGGPAPDAER